MRVDITDIRASKSSMMRRGIGEKLTGKWEMSFDFESPMTVIF